jgi:hypothetical protein
VKLALLTVAALGVLALLASTAGGASPDANGCSQGPRTIGGTEVYVYCGPGRATVRTGGRSFAIARGSCGWRRARALYVVNIGIRTTGKGTSRTRYLGIRTPHRRPGTYGDAGVEIQVKGEEITLGPSTMTIAKDLRH